MRYRIRTTFAGGIDLPHEKRATLDEAVRVCRVLTSLRVPLAPWGAAAAELIVRPGQRVSSGDRLARGLDDGVDVFAPLDATVGAL